MQHRSECSRWKAVSLKCYQCFTLNVVRFGAKIIMNRCFDFYFFFVLFLGLFGVYCHTFNTATSQRKQKQENKLVTLCPVFILTNTDTVCRKMLFWNLLNVISQCFKRKTDKPRHKSQRLGEIGPVVNAKTCFLLFG